ncbi:hypothetical protein [Amniculibacterium sp. G2-70]|uniref:hypothetical protein n=1 Tax=Amniculibacterium sp. G2-70 TaxID=2767188 RepID=UPI001654800B|nr:hypothetical protein [Amniculibacterium sp. G2-70]
MRNKCKQFIDFLFDKSGIISAILVIALSVIDISNVNEWKGGFFGAKEFAYGKIIYYIVVFSALIFGIISLIHGTEVSKIEKDNISKGEKIIDLENRLNDLVGETSELFNSYLKLLIKSLDFKHTERISVYKVYNNRFKLIGRTSIDPTLMEMGRNDYPIDEGFIGKGWKEGDFFCDNLPEITQGRNGINNYYNRVNNIFPISKNVVEGIRMKSRNFYVYRIDGYDGNPKAVLVFESLNPTTFTKDSILEKLSDIEEPLMMFIEKNNGIALTENILGI